jgi:hypothetical protein
MPNTIQITLEIDDKGGIKIRNTSKDMQELNKKVQEAQSPLSKLTEGYGLFTAKLTATIAAIYSAKKLIFDLPLSIASAANEIERESKVLGLNTDEFQKYSYAAKLSDISLQDLTMGLKLLSRSMEDASKGTGDASKYFTAMNVSIKDTQGNLRPLNGVMMDIMDRFASWEDGPRKIAIAMQLFGRSGEALIPFLNKGRSGFEDLSREAERLGIILSPDLIRKGGEAEDIFKKLEVQTKALKLSFAGYALELAKAANDIVEFFRKTEEAYQRSWFKKFMDFPGKLSSTFWDKWNKLGQALGIVQPPSVPETPESRYLAAWQARPKTQPPAVGEPGITAEEIEKDVLAFNQLLATVDQLSETGKMPSWEDSIFVYLKQALPDVNALNLAFSQLLANAENLSAAGQMPDWRESLEEIPKGFVEIENHLYSLQEIIESYDTTAAAWVVDWVKNWKTASDELEIIWDSLAKNISDVWATNMTHMIREAETFADGFKNIIDNMVDIFISAIMKMITNWAIFGSITGEKQGGSYGGLVGLVGSLVTTIFGEGGVVKGWRPLAEIPRFQSGAIVDRPTLAMGGEAEWIIPQSKIGKASGTGEDRLVANVFYVYALDPISFRDFAKRNPEAFIEVFHKDIRNRGTMRSDMKRYG